MANEDLVHLIDLSLGVEPQGVVNFNYLHGLLHELVRRLVDIEQGSSSIPISGTDNQLLLLRDEKEKLSDVSGKKKGDRHRIQGKGGKVDRKGKPRGEKGVPSKTDLSASKTDIDASKSDLDASKSDLDVSKTDLIRKGLSASKTDLAEKEDEEDGGDQLASGRESGGSSPSPRHTLYSGIRAATSYVRSRPNIVSAANDVGALERKMLALEQRVNTMESLPEMLDRMSQDIGATPVSDIWNFSNLKNRLSATEESLDKTSRIVDNLLGQLSELKSHVSDKDDFGRRISEHFSGELDTIQDKLKELEKLKLAAAEGSLGEVAATMMAELDSKVEKIQEELHNLKMASSSGTGVDLSGLATASDVQDIVSGAIRDHVESFHSQKDSLAQLEQAMSESREAVSKLSDRVDGMEDELGRVPKMLQEMQASLRHKVDAADISALMPTGEGGGASVMPKILEMQTQINDLEAKVGGVPQDMQDQMSAMRKIIDRQSDELSSLSGLVDSLQARQTGDSQGNKFEEFGSQLAQLRERLTELDRAMTALSDHMASMSRQDPGLLLDPDGEKFVDQDSFNAVQGLLEQLQQEHERLMGTAAHLSHELDVNKEHVKSLYDGVDDLKSNKADRTQVEVEVREKADRKALDDKASRDWVDSTFEKLDKEIREARSKMMGQEEAFKLAVTQLSEDVEGKLDRLELQPLKDYFDKKLDNVRTVPKSLSERDAIVDDAAGIKKPLRFACLSCDKPVDMKQLGIIPTLPSIATLPGTRTFRPYTTYELEMIRRHQKILYPLPPLVDFNRAARSAGGTHTLTRPHQRFRLAPFGVSASPFTIPSPEPHHMTSVSSPMVYDETDIVGQNGQIYKGRVTRKKLPTFKRKSRSRPLTSPMKPNSPYKY